MRSGLIPLIYIQLGLSIHTHGNEYNALYTRRTGNRKTNHGLRNTPSIKSETQWIYKTFFLLWKVERVINCGLPSTRKNRIFGTYTSMKGRRIDISIANVRIPIVADGRLWTGRSLNRPRDEGRFSVAQQKKTKIQNDFLL